MPISRLKVCFIVPEYNSEIATHFYSIYKMVDLLAQKADIFLIAEKGRDRGASDNFKILIQKFHLLPGRWLENLIFLISARRSGYSNFYIHYSFVAALNASIVAKIFGGKVFYWNCGLPWLYHKNFLRNQLERLVYQLIDFLVTGTESLKKEYAAHYAISQNKIRVMSNWVDLEKFKPSSTEINAVQEKLNLPAGAKILLFAHRLSKRKGANYLPEILRALKNENVVLLVIGDGPEREASNSRFILYNLQSKVRMLGWIPNGQLSRYYALADVFLMPSEEEGFPHVLLESMAAAVPFVASDVGGVREIVPEVMKPYLVKAGDAGQFADKIRELLYNQPEVKAFMKAALVHWVERYNIRNSTRVFINLIQNS